jgi:hypothetical protein
VVVALVKDGVVFVATLLDRVSAGVAVVADPVPSAATDVAVPGVVIDE